MSRRAISDLVRIFMRGGPKRCRFRCPTSIRMRRSKKRALKLHAVPIWYTRRCCRSFRRLNLIKQFRAELRGEFLVDRLHGFSECDEVDGIHQHALGFKLLERVLLNLLREVELITLQGPRLILNT